MRNIGEELDFHFRDFLLDINVVLHLNHEEGQAQPDPECDLDYVPNVGRAQNMTYALSNSLGFGGHNACIALRRWEE